MDLLLIFKSLSFVFLFCIFLVTVCDWIVERKVFAGVFLFLLDQFIFIFETLVHHLYFMLSRFYDFENKLILEVIELYTELNVLQILLASQHQIEPNRVLSALSFLTRVLL